MFPAAPARELPSRLHFPLSDTYPPCRVDEYVDPWREAPSAPPLGELLSEREAEGVRYGERYAPGFTYAAVGADSIRPQPRIFDSTRLNGTRPGAKRPCLPW